MTTVTSSSRYSIPNYSSKGDDVTVGSSPLLRAHLRLYGSPRDIALHSWARAFAGDALPVPIVLNIQVGVSCVRILHIFRLP